MAATFSLFNVLTEIKSSLKLALPLIAAELIYSVSTFISIIMVAHLGEDQLAANALVLNIYIALTLFFVGLLTSTSVFISQSAGAKDKVGISISFKQGLIMSFVFAIPIILVLWVSPEFLIFAKQDPHIVHLTRPFFHALIWSILPLNLSFVMQQFLVGIGRTRPVMFISILSVPIEILFYYLLVFGKFGMPKLGLAGIGFGLFISAFLITAYSIFYLYFSGLAKSYQLFTKWWVINKKFLFEMIRVGLPLGFTFCIEITLFVVIAIMMGILGTPVLAAYQIAYQYLMVALLILFGLSQAITVRIGIEVGQHNRNALKLIAWVNMGIAFSLMSIFSVFMIGFPRLAISLDLSSYRSIPIIAEARVFLILAGILVFTECLRFVSTASLRGLKDTKIPLLISIVGFWLIAFPIAYLFGFKFHQGGIGIWWGLIIGLSLVGVVLFMRFNYLVKNINLAAIVTKSTNTN